VISNKEKCLFVWKKGESIGLPIEQGAPLKKASPTSSMSTRNNKRGKIATKRSQKRFSPDGPSSEGPSCLGWECVGPRRVGKKLGHKRVFP